MTTTLTKARPQGVMTVQVQPIAEEEDVPTCYVCMEPVDGTAVRNVCRCKGLVMHLECQRRLLEQVPGQMQPNGVCKVCNAPYSNVKLRAHYKPTKLLYAAVCGFLSLPIAVVVIVLNEGPLKMMYPGEPPHAGIAHQSFGNAAEGDRFRFVGISQHLSTDGRIHLADAALGRHQLDTLLSVFRDRHIGMRGLH